MGTNKPWKAHERKSARRFGAERVLAGGVGNFKTHSDSIHTEIYLECKYRKEQPILRSVFRPWEIACDKYMNKLKKERIKLGLDLPECRVPVLELRREGKRECFIVVRDTDLHLIQPGYANIMTNFIVKKSIAVATLFDDTLQKATIENKIPCLSLKERGKHGCLLVFLPKHLNILQQWNKQNQTS